LDNTQLTEKQQFDTAMDWVHERVKNI